MDERLYKRITSRTTTIDDFNFDNMIAPPLLSFITVQDIEYFRYLATSIKYSAKIDYKYQEIDRIMKMRGFVKLTAGTNRVVYRCLENQSIVLKIAIDDVGMKDNPREFMNQRIFKPYVTKVFEISPCGTVALVERVQNIKSREEFMSIAGDVFDVLSKWFVGEYILEDVGTKFFMNWGVRPGFGCVLLDFPYVYKLDGNKLYCQSILNDGSICDGEIDYDEGFNHLYCTKCGREYKAVDLKKLEDENLIIKKGSIKIMDETKVIVRRGDKVIKTSGDNGKKKISKRERIYNSLPKITDGMIVKVSGGKLADKSVQKAIASSGYNQKEKPQEDFDTHSQFIPEPEDEQEEEFDYTKVPEEEKSDLYKSVENILDGKSDKDDSEEVDREYKEEHLNLDPTDEENIPDDEDAEDDADDESKYAAIPVGAIPVGQLNNVDKNISDKNNKRSRRFDPEFYKGL